MNETTITLSIAAAAQTAVALVAYGQLRQQVQNLREDVQELKQEIARLAPRALRPNGHPKK